jgi:hypothetical protein
VFLTQAGTASLCAEAANGKVATAATSAKSRMVFLVMIFDFALKVFS